MAGTQAGEKERRTTKGHFKRVLTELIAGDSNHR
jgi:hypothetical protein